MGVQVRRRGRRETGVCLSWKENSQWFSKCPPKKCGYSVDFERNLMESSGKMAWEWWKQTWKSAKEPMNKPQRTIFQPKKSCSVYCLGFSEMTALEIESVFSFQDQAAGLGTSGVEGWQIRAWAHLSTLLNKPCMLAYHWNGWGLGLSG